MLRKIGNTMLNVPKHTNPASASGLMVSGPGVLYGALVKTDGTNAATFTFHDGTTVSGSSLLPDDLVVAGAENIKLIEAGKGVYFTNGVYVESACSGTYSYQVYYDN